MPCAQGHAEGAAWFGPAAAKTIPFSSAVAAAGAAAVGAEELGKTPEGDEAEAAAQAVPLTVQQANMAVIRQAWQVWPRPEALQQAAGSCTAACLPHADPAGISVICHHHVSGLPLLHVRYLHSLRTVPSAQHSHLFAFCSYVKSSGLLGDELPKVCRLCKGAWQGAWHEPALACLQVLFYGRIFADIVGRFAPRRKELLVRDPTTLLSMAVFKVCLPAGPAHGGYTAATEPACCMFFRWC